MRKLTLSVLVLGLLAVVCAGQTIKPLPPVRWQVQGCITLDAVTELLNSLPAERASEAKVTTINSQRSFLGPLSTPYYVWYRK